MRLPQCLVDLIRDSVEPQGRQHDDGVRSADALDSKRHLQGIAAADDDRTRLSRAH